MNISIIIPNYNGENLLKKNLPKVYNAVRDYNDGKIEIIIPDDPSTDRSAEVIDKFIGYIRKKNIIGKTISNKDKAKAGFGKNVNRAASIATGDILILLNSDVYPKEDFLKPLLKNFERPDVFAVGCLDESVESNGEIVYRGRGIGEFRRGFLLHGKGEINKDDTLWVSGGSGAFRKSVWDKLQGLDTIYDPFYWEDIDLSYQAQKQGFRILFEAKSVVTHEHATGVVKKHFSENYVKKISYRNQFIFVWKNITEKRLLISHLIWLPYHLLKALMVSDWMFFLGFFNALLKLTEVIEKRRKNTKYFVRLDTDIFKMHSD